MSYFYVLIDSSSRPYGISQLGEPITRADMIPTDSLEFDFGGKVWDGAAWIDDPSSPVTPPRMRLTKLEFRNQFTFAEKQAIYTAAETSVDIEIFLDDLMAAEYIDCDNSNTITNVNALETAGLIAAGRADEILAGVTD